MIFCDNDQCPLHREVPGDTWHTLRVLKGPISDSDISESVPCETIIHTRHAWRIDKREFWLCDDCHNAVCKPSFKP